MKYSLANFWRNNRSFVLFILLMSIFRSAVADWNTVPTGSMKPTIIEGDRILVNKMAYDIRLPFTLISLHKIADPVRGDIIIFDSKISDKRLVKRVIGVPGDVVAMSNNVITINGKILDYQQIANHGHEIDQLENLLGTEHAIRVREQGSRWAHFAPTIVPANSYLAMGDNRDNSADSRMIGFIPRHEIVGRTQQVVMSFNYDNYYIPRKNRFLEPLL